MPSTMESRLRLPHPRHWHSTSYRHLQRLAEVSNEGLRRLQPELRRGQQRVLLIVSDSTIVFCKGSKKKRNFMKVMPTESLQKECKKDGGFSSYREIVCSPLWARRSVT